MDKNDKAEFYLTLWYVETEQKLSTLMIEKQNLMGQLRDLAIAEHEIAETLKEMADCLVDCPAFKEYNEQKAVLAKRDDEISRVIDTASEA